MTRLRMYRRIRSRSPLETTRLAANFSRQLKGGDVVLLEGGLGSGKTTFVKGLARGLGLKGTRIVKSPTFVLMRMYPTRIPLYHFDLYRLDSEEDLGTIGLEEFLRDPEAVVCVEWADKAPAFFPRASFRVRLEMAGPQSRYLTLERDPGCVSQKS